MTLCVGVACVRNESDVIELWARYNLQLLDELHVIDHLSADRTRWVLQQLQDEGLPVHLHTSDNPVFQQGRLVTQMARARQVQSPVDFFVPLDADELIALPSRETLHAALATIPANAAGAVYWQTYLPAPDDAGDAAFFRRMTQYRSHENKAHGKLILRGPLCPFYEWWTGFHHAYHVDSRQDIARAELSFRLAHFPVRDAWQLARKVIVGAHAISMKPDRGEREGWHWLDLARQLREARYDATVLNLREVALTYSLGPEVLAMEQVLEGAVPDFPGIEQRYPVPALSLPEIMGQCLESVAARPPRGDAQAGFSEDRFSRHLTNWRYWLTGLKDVPNARFLEIGAGEGQATVWLLGNALTRPDARVVCVDTFRDRAENADAPPTDVLPRFRANVAPWQHKVVECVGDPEQILPRLQERFDAISIDGSRLALDRLRDAVLAWSLLKPGGVMILADYSWNGQQDPALQPRTAIDGFLACIGGRYRLLGKDEQVALQKL